MNNNLFLWKSFFNASEMSDLVFLVMFFVLFYILIFFPIMGLFSFIVKKTIADQQARIGPKNIGLNGLFQGTADSIKLIFKNTRKVEKKNHLFVLIFIASFSMFSLLPFSEAMFLSDAFFSSIGIFLVLVLCRFFMFYLAGSFFGVSGYIQAIGHSIVGLLCFFPSLLSFFLVTSSVGSMDWNSIVNAQGFWFYEWNIFKNPPFFFSSFFVFILSGWIMLGVYPITQSSALGTSTLHAEEDKMGGVFYYFSSILKFLFFYSWTLMAIALFCGGWKLPYFIFNYVHGENMILFKFIIEFLIINFKAILLMIFANWLFAAIPRARPDQSTDFIWKVLSIVAILSFTGSILFYYLEIF